jgi:hypothetical protein
LVLYSSCFIQFLFQSAVSKTVCYRHYDGY